MKTLALANVRYIAILWWKRAEKEVSVMGMDELSEYIHETWWFNHCKQCPKCDAVPNDMSLWEHLHEMCDEGRRVWTGLMEES